MNEVIIYLLVGVVTGGLIAWLIATLRIKSTTISKREFNAVNNDLNVQKEKVRSLNETLQKLGIDLTKLIISSSRRDTRTLLLVVLSMIFVL